MAIWGIKKDVSFERRDGFYGYSPMEGVEGTSLQISCCKVSECVLIRQRRSGLSSRMGCCACVRHPETRTKFVLDYGDYLKIPEIKERGIKRAPIQSDFQKYRESVIGQVTKNQMWFLSWFRGSLVQHNVEEQLDPLNCYFIEVDLDITEAEGVQVRGVYLQQYGENIPSVDIGSAKDGKKDLEEDGYLSMGLTLNFHAAFERHTIYFGVHMELPFKEEGFIWPSHEGPPWNYAIHRALSDRLPGESSLFDPNATTARLFRDECMHTGQCKCKRRQKIEQKREQERKASRIRSRQPVREDGWVTVELPCLRSEEERKHKISCQC